MGTARACSPGEGAELPAGGSGARAYVALGSNLDDPVAQVRRAVRGLGEISGTRVAACSRLYRSPPMGPPGQPPYINAVAALDTVLDPWLLLDALQAIEARQGRTRSGERWGPRTLDLDLILYGDRVVDTERLTLPHPGVAERGFVLHPLAEVAPEAMIPGRGPVRVLAAALPADDLEILGEA